MKRQKYIFKWVLSTVYDSKTHTFNDDNRKPITDCGSDSICRIDGRYSLSTITQKSEDWIKKHGGIGYSIGYLETHDPHEKYSQAIKKFTRV